MLNAGVFVSNSSENLDVKNGVIMFGEYKGVRVGVIKTSDNIGTIFPDADMQP